MLQQYATLLKNLAAKNFRLEFETKIRTWSPTLVLKIIKSV